MTTRDPQKARADARANDRRRERLETRAEGAGSDARSDSRSDARSDSRFDSLSGARLDQRYETVGARLRRARVAKEMTVSEVSRVTRIPTHTLEKIEGDLFDDLPGEVFVRGFLKAYAQAVGADPSDILARYTASRRVAVATPLPVTSPVQAAREGQGRRFGVAIALVLLLILFTLAISIVLKPRGRDIPHELSDNTNESSARTPDTQPRQLSCATIIVISAMARPSRAMRPIR